MAAASVIRDFPAWPVPTVGSSAACHGRLRVYGKIGIQCYKARENVASEGTCERRSQPRMRCSDLSTSRRSIRAVVVGTPSTALAARAEYSGLAPLRDER